MVAKIARRRGEQSGLIRHEIASRTMIGVRGVALHEAAGSDSACRFAAMGREVVALVRRDPTEIDVVPNRVGTSMRPPFGSRYYPASGVAAAAGKAADGFDNFPADFDAERCGSPRSGLEH